MITGRGLSLQFHLVLVALAPRVQILMFVLFSLFRWLPFLVLIVNLLGMNSVKRLGLSGWWRFATHFWFGLRRFPWFRQKWRLPFTC